MTKTVKIQASDEAWDSGQLGREEEHAKRLEENIEAKIDEALELQLISLRLQKSLIEDFKQIATLNGIGYQPLMRQVLKRFADAEKKRILRERAAEIRAAQTASQKAQAAAQKDRPPRQRRAA